MKKFILPIILIAITIPATEALLPSSGNDPRQDSITASASWILFCNARGYDPSTEDPEAIDEYLDAWVGTTEEEKAFNRLPAE